MAKKFVHYQTGLFPYAMTDIIYIKIRENHRVVSKSYHITIVISEDGECEIIGLMTQDDESDKSWSFLMPIKDWSKVIKKAIPF